LQIQQKSTKYQENTISKGAALSKIGEFPEVSKIVFETSFKERHTRVC